MRRFIAVLAAGLLAAGAIPAADELIPIKIKKPTPGVVTEETKTEKGTNKTTFTVMGKDKVQEESGSSRLVFREEVIERPEGSPRPTRLKRTYETATITKEDAGQDLGLAGKTVLIEKKGDRYEYTIDGKPVTGPAANLLAKEFGRPKTVSEDDLFPKDPVKVGGTWKIDTAKLARDLANDGMTVDAEKSTATGKLVKVYDKGGRKFGVMEMRMELVLTALKGGPETIQLKEGSKLTITVDADACIDGTEDTGKAKLTMKGYMVGETNGVGLKIEMNAVQDNVSTEVKKK